MKKIKLIIYHPYSYLGGADTSLKRLLSNLDYSKYSITFISLQKSVVEKDLKSKIEFINLKCSRALFSIFKLRNIVKKYEFSEQFQKVIIFSNQNFGNIISFFSLVGVRNIKKIFIDRNHLDELKYGNGIFAKSKNLLIKNLIKFIYKYADLIIGISKKLSKDLSNFCNAKVITIYSPAYDTSIIKKASNKINLSKKFKYIINVSRFTPRKDHATTIKAFKLASDKIKNLKLILIGYGPEYLKIKNFIENLKINKKVIILNNENNPYPYIKQSELLVLSSKYEGMSNVLVESLMLNTPVISSNCNAGPAEILLNGRGGDLFQVSNHIDLANKIIKHFKNRNIQIKKIKIAKKKLFRFDLKNHIKIYSAIFKKI